MYFPLLILHSWGKRSAAQPQTIYSEIPVYPIYRGLTRFKNWGRPKFCRESEKVCRMLANR